VKIADFGIASANLFREEVGVLKGKFGYMSPEQARGERVDRRSDIYALGVVLYELLTLRSPYDKRGGRRHAAPRREDRAPWDPRPAHARPRGPRATSRPSCSAPWRSARRRTSASPRRRDLAAAIARALHRQARSCIDHSSVEGMLSSLLVRGHEPGEPVESSEVPRELATQAAIRVPRPGDTPAPAEALHAPARAVREVRHVAVVTLRLEGLHELEEAQGAQQARRSAEAVKATLEAIAFKHGAVWSWDAAGAARAIVGLLANPSRAAVDSATLAVDVHEALAGASDDLPRELRAAIGIVRGIATGIRDDQGHLVQHHLHEPAPFLADRLASDTPFGRTWVAGGVYRLVRRDFRWGDAPTLALEPRPELQVPREMRLYTLLRPLTKEERMTELAQAPNDLVGRDAEKADLLAAYHTAVSSEGPASASLRPPAASLAPPSGGAGGAAGAGGPSSSTPPSGEGEAAPRELAPSAPVAESAPQVRGELTARVVVGEMGIGKTALVATFLAELPTVAHVVQVECSPVKAELPLATVCDVLRDVTGLGLDSSIEEATQVVRTRLGPGARSSQASRLVTRVVELITGKSEREDDDDSPGYRRELVVSGLRLLLGSLARSQPLVVVIDGLQWADRASLEILQELLRRTERFPILVLLVTRPEERVAPFLENLVQIELRGLSPEEQLRLVEARLGLRRGVEAVCAELVPRVAGNPFFLLEMVDALLERGALEIVERPDGSHELVQRDRGERAEALPSTLEQLIGDRVRELPREEHDVVDWLAVAGGPLSVGDLVTLTRLPDDEAITRLCARGLCDRKGDSVDFRHPLARDVAYLALDSSTRARMHRGLGEHLATTPLAQGLSAAIVARHFARGEAPTSAAELYLEAASAARNGNQSQLAERYYQRALSLLPEGDAQRVDAHAALEAIYRHLGRRRDRRKHLLALRRIARDSAQASTVALALTRTARLDVDEGHFARGLPIAQRAAEIARLAKQPTLEVEAHAMLSDMLRELGDAQGALRAVERALSVAHEGKLPARARAEVLRTKGVLLRYVGRVREATETHAEAIAVFSAVGARRSEARARNALAFALFIQERFEDTIALGLSSVAIDVAIGGRFQMAKTLSNVGQAYARLGDTAKGLAYLRRAREAHERYGDQDSRADTLLSSAWVLIEAGDVDAADTLCRDASALIAVTGSVYDGVQERVIRALLARSRGDADTALARASEARQLAESQGLMSLHVYAMAIEAASRVDAGELQAGALLARTALGAVEASEANEYGIEVRALAAEALRRATPSAANDAALKAASHVRLVASYIRDPLLFEAFLARPVVDGALAEESALAPEAPPLVGPAPRSRPELGPSSAGSPAGAAPSARAPSARAPSAGAPAKGAWRS
jgi:tetratricopeptide (TPR) repeat protein